MANYFYTSCVRYLDKNVTECEQTLYNVWWQEQINQYGSQILYWVNNLSLSAMDPLYGEDTPSIFSNPLSLIALTDLSQSQMFSKWALMGDDFTSIVVHITAFQDTFGQGAEPKSGDIFKLYEYGLGRPGGRDGKMFEVTERLDEEISQTNPLLGHYVWLIKAKRYQYTFEPNVSAEAVTDQIYDNTFTGRLSGGENPTTPPKAYPAESVDEIVKETIFDYSLSTNGIDNEYGGYTDLT